MMVSFIYDTGLRGNFPMHRKKGEGVGGRSEHWLPDRASDAQRLNVGLMAPGLQNPRLSSQGSS